ncbi:ATP-binding protein [Natronorubrum halophilum]|uniref:ATP-binding protein n=1 Tax=Natronorubrum halophilum TaxID=1702106 RepID=UPI000EF70AFB|nr:ATP-binding protein [Natronorubrum halophilum]
MATSDPPIGQLRSRVRQQEVVAELGQQALESPDIERLLDDAVDAVRDALEVDYCGIFEVLPDADTVVLRHGDGWQDNRVGSATIPTGSDSQTEYALASEGPVVVTDFETENRFSDSALLADHDVTSGISAVVGSPKEPWGVLSVHATAEREFTEHDATFVERVANVVASAIDNQRPRRTLEGELETTFDRVTDAFFGLNTDWEVTFVNDRAQKLIDPDDAGPIGECIWELVPDLVDSTFEAECRRAMSTQEPTSFEEYVSSLETWLEVRAYPSPTGLSIFLRDGSERTEIERELHQNNRTLQRLYAITADRERSFDEKVQQLLEVGCERLGLEVGFVADIDERNDRFEVVHASGNDDRLQPGSVTNLSDTYCRRTIESDGLLVLTNAPVEGWGDDHAYDRWDFDSYLGGRIHVEGDLYGTLCFADDTARSTSFTPAERSFVELLTQWLSYELERQRHQQELEELVADLEASNERLEQFAYAASHDLQEPLRMVASYLSLVERRYADELDEDGQEFIEYAVDGATRMQRMIDGLLAYSRVDTQDNPLETVDIGAIIEDVVTDLEVRIEETGADITVEPLPTVYGDPGQLRQVFQNLLDNAITYAGEQPPRISVFAAKDGHQWEISVRDWGIGIDPDDADHIFQVFNRLHSADEYDGAGIGLALCDRIVERHDGDIRVDSTPGEGATFSVTLPAPPDTAATGTHE